MNLDSRSLRRDSDEVSAHHNYEPSDPNQSSAPGETIAGGAF